MHVLACVCDTDVARYVSTLGGHPQRIDGTVLSWCICGGIQHADGAGGHRRFLGNAALWELAYLSLVYCYFLGFFNVGESARRVRLLIELESAGTRGLTLQEILSAYNADMIVTARLARLVASGQILERDGQYYMGKPLMLAVAKTSVLLKRVFLGSRSEFGEARPSGISSPPARGSL